jgi:hypothetical protein
MLLAGKREHGQYHLSDPDQYDLGLIDLETAVAFRGSEDGLMRQPMLAGTPSYMTPSHLFSNFALIDVYGNKLSAVFCLQDWFAAVGIIFCIVTGQRLFEKTAKLLPEIVRVKKRGLNRNDPETEILKNVSRIFWKTAGDEFSEMIRTHLQRLENIHLALPDPIVDLFRSEAENSGIRIRDAVEQCANSQNLFPQQAKKLISASVDAVRTQRIKWENKEPGKNVPPDIREQAISLFQQLETLKSRLKNLDDSGCLIKKAVSCEELLRFMFNQMVLAMQCE